MIPLFICICIQNAYWDSISLLHQLIRSWPSWLLNLKNLPGMTFLFSLPANSSWALTFESWSLNLFLSFAGSKMYFFIKAYSPAPPIMTTTPKRSFLVVDNAAKLVYQFCSSSLSSRSPAQALLIDFLLKSSFIEGITGSSCFWPLV